MEREQKRKARVELVSTVLLSLATLLTAWSAYQATRWSGEQSIAFAEASSARIESAKASERAGTLEGFDVALLTSFVEALFDEKPELANELETRYFREDFKPAFEEWLNGLEDEDAPATPFDADSYELQEMVESERLAARSDVLLEEAREANQTGDNYIFATIFFAAVLFFAGIATKFDFARGQQAMLALAGLMVLAGILRIATLPVI